MKFPRSWLNETRIHFFYHVSHKIRNIYQINLKYIGQGNWLILYIQSFHFFYLNNENNRSDRPGLLCAFSITYKINSAKTAIVQTITEKIQRTRKIFAWKLNNDTFFFFLFTKPVLRQRRPDAIGETSERSLGIHYKRLGYCYPGFYLLV